MKDTAHDYYAVLRANYETEIRRLVPKYDEMVGTVMDLLAHHRPQRVLDVGSGVGNVAQRVLEALPDTRLIAIDASDVMAEDTRRRLAPFGDRAQIVRTDIADFAPGHRFDAIYSNLVIHNIPFDNKPGVLAQLAAWLTTNGVFVWSDLTRLVDARLQRHFLQYRIDYALAAGCDRDFVQRSFDKEAQEDYQYTIAEALEVARRAGLVGEVVWAHDTFAIIHLTR